MEDTNLLCTKHYPSVPPLYIDVANLLTTIESRHMSFKTAFYSGGLQWNSNFKAVYALALNAVNHLKLGHELYKAANFNEIQPPKNLVLAIITDLLWGKKHVYGTNKIILSLVKQRAHLKETLKEIEKSNEGTFNKLTVRFCRVNKLKVSMEEIFAYLKENYVNLVETPSSYAEYVERAKGLKMDEFMVDFHFKNFLVFSNKASTTIIDDNWCKTGALVLQDKSSEAAVKVLDPEKNSVVVDLCAAPGMKTSSIADLMENTGTIYACDLHNKRLKMMENILKDYGVKNVKSIACDSTKIPVGFDSKEVDYILLDAPCSGSGMVRRGGSLDVINPDRLNKLHGLQCKLLKNALKNFKQAKRIIYSTCSLQEEENEAVIEEVLNLASYKGWELKDAHSFLEGFSKGKEKYSCGNKCLYFLPDKDMSNGFFLAVFERADGQTNLPVRGKKRKHDQMIHNNSDHEENSKYVSSENNTNVNQKKRKKRNKNKRTRNEKNDNLCLPATEGSPTVNEGEQKEFIKERQKRNEESSEAERIVNEVNSVAAICNDKNKEGKIRQKKKRLRKRNKSVKRLKEAEVNFDISENIDKESNKKKEEKCN